MSEQEQSAQDQVENYRKLVLQYETLDERIDTLLASYGGHTEDMSADDLTRYRELAFKRAEVLNEMRLMERQLFEDGGMD